MIEKIKQIFKKYENSNTALTFCIIISICIVTTTFAMPNLFNKNESSKETISKSVEVELTEKESDIKLTKSGDTNIGNGGNGGDYDTVTGDYTILDNEQDEGVRVTLVETDTNKPVTTPIDFANNPRQPIDVHFGGGNKLYYIKNPTITFYDGKGYNWEIPQVKLPKIINGSLSTIKKYFGSEPFLRDFSQITGFNYAEMISGKYKIMLEPVGYPKIAGKVTACTATELALLNIKKNGAIRRSAIQIFSHLNLPMAMFLEKDEFGIKKWTGSTVSKQDDTTIIAQLGVGAITFTEIPPEEPVTPPPTNYVYRTDTDVYTSIELSGIECLLNYNDQTRRNPVTVTFNIGGKIYPSVNKNIMFPSTGIAYVKWRTPSKPQDMVITAKVNYNELEFNKAGKPIIKNKTDEYEIGVKIVKLEENPPPNPDADDRNNGWRIAEPPKIADDDKENVWYEYSVEEEREPVYDDEGNWKYDKKAWIWTTYEYKAYLGAFLNVYPDPLCETYKIQNFGSYRDVKAGINETRKLYRMKSGYGIRQKIETRLVVQKTTTVTHLNGDKERYVDTVYNVAVAPQNAINYFSDFNFQKYFRLSEVTELNSNQSTLEFKKNRFSTYENRTHFTPIWYPDKEFYVVNSMIFDSWTPSGQLYIGATTTRGEQVEEKTAGNAIYIKGNLWDDWYVQPLPTYGTEPRKQ